MISDFICEGYALNRWFSKHRKPLELVASLSLEAVPKGII